MSKLTVLNNKIEQELVKKFKSPSFLTMLADAYLDFGSIKQALANLGYNYSTWIEAVRLDPNIEKELQKYVKKTVKHKTSMTMMYAFQKALLVMIREMNKEGELATRTASKVLQHLSNIMVFDLEDGEDTQDNQADETLKQLLIKRGKKKKTNS